MLISSYNLLLQELDGLREKLAAVRQVLIDGGHDGASDDAACAALRLIARVPVHVTCGERHQIGTQCPSGVPARAPDPVTAGFVLVPVDAPESLRGQLCGYGADLSYMDPRDRAVILQRGADRWAEIIRWAGACGVGGAA